MTIYEENGRTVIDMAGTIIFSKNQFDVNAIKCDSPISLRNFFIIRCSPQINRLSRFLRWAWHLWRFSKYSVDLLEEKKKRDETYSFRVLKDKNEHGENSYSIEEITKES
jgi:hypothetical protein